MRRPERPLPDDVAARLDAVEAAIRRMEIRLEALSARLEEGDREAKLERRLELAEASLARARVASEGLWRSRPWRLYLGLTSAGRRWALRLRAVGGAASRWRRRLRLESSLKARLRAAGVTFPQVSEPEVSVVVPVRDGIESTVRCLESIHRSANRTSFEVIVVDDGSSDCSPGVLASIGNLEVVRREEPGGWAAAANAGAERARGSHLLFLRGATAVGGGWLDELRSTLLAVEEAGIVGSKLLDAEGRLLEAGGLVSRDGSLSKRGRGEDAGHPRYNYRREVDYCSAASLMIPRGLFRSVGGFDPALAASDSTGAELALRVRASGKKVLLQPLSVVWTDPGQAAGDHEGTREDFRRRWRGELESQPSAAAPELRDGERSARQRVLIIDHRLPTPDQDSGSLRMVNLLEVLQGVGAEVSFIPHDLIPMQPYTDDLRRSGIEVWCWPPTVSIEAHLKAAGGSYDVALLSRQHVAWRTIGAVERHCPRATIVFDTVDLQFLRQRRRGELTGDPAALRQARLTEVKELDLVRRSDLTLVVSPAEKRMLEELVPGAKVAILSNIHRIHGSRKPFEERRDIFFIGGFEHRPNVDSVRWLVAEIVPHLRRLLPGVRLYVIGSKPPEEVLALAADDVEVLGHVADVEPYFADCRLTLAPLRYGAGVKGKINQSMAWGVPCVATRVAVEGMGLRDGDDVLVADDPLHFAESVRRAYTDRELWARLSRGGLENVRQRFSFEAARAALLDALPGLTSEPGAARERGEGADSR